MDLFDYLIMKSDSFPDSAPLPQILGSSKPHAMHAGIIASTSFT